MNPVTWIEAANAWVESLSVDGIIALMSAIIGLAYVFIAAGQRATPPPPQPEPKPRPASSGTLTTKEREALETIAGWGASHPTGPAQGLADAMRRNFPGTDDVTLGRMALHMRWLLRSRHARGDDVIAIAAVLGLAADQLTQLERTTAP